MCNRIPAHQEATEERWCTISFLEWYSDPDVAEERREIMRLLACSEDDAVKHQEIARLAEAVEVMASGAFVPDDEEDDDPPLGV